VSMSSYGILCPKTMIHERLDEIFVAGKIWRPALYLVFDKKRNRLSLRD
jgi:hypothetical protein